VEVFEVFLRRTHDDPLVHVGSLEAPDIEMALALARETFFRHGEGVDGWVVRRADLRRIPDPETLGGVTDKSYRRSEGYAGVGARLRRVREELRARGLAVDAPRPGRTEEP
jgi:ring-1,2-phenylacetyl-CoA epoxidase subunit PaaB